MQIIQEKIDKIVLKIVRDSAFSNNSENQLLREFADIFGTDVDIGISFVNEIRPENIGKYRFCISHVRNGFDLHSFLGMI